MPMTIHTSISIAGYLARPDPELIGLFMVTDETGTRPCLGSEARAILQAEYARGMRRLPIGNPCEGFDYQQDGCPGHPSGDG